MPRGAVLEVPTGVEHGVDETPRLGALAIEVQLGAEDVETAPVDLDRYARAVIAPAIGQPRGLPRLRAIMENWFRWVCDNPDGCVILAAAHEYDARPGLLHDRVVDWLLQLRQQLVKAIGMCIDTGELSPKTDPVLLAFELFAVAQGLHDARLYDAEQAPLLARRSLDRLLASYGAPAVSTPA